MVVNHFGAEPLDVVPHALHQVWPLEALDVAGPIVHVGGGGELPPHLDAGDERRAKVRPCRVERGGVAGRTGAEHHQTALLHQVAASGVAAASNAK